MAIRIWTGRVDSLSEQPVNTGLNFREGARVTIVSSGFAVYDPEDKNEAFGPTGDINTIRINAVAPEEWIGALLVKTGSIYTSLSGGLLNWSPPTDDNVEFVYNDVPRGYADNQGGFDVTMQYDDEDLAI